MAPFQGTMQVIRAGATEAECRDGKTWVIYIASDSILSHTGMNEVRYGTWSLKKGLCPAPNQGSPLPQDYREMLNQMVEALQEKSSGIPFPAIDQYEQWLLSRDELQPLALLNTAIHYDEFNPRQAPYDWRPSQSIISHFKSEHGAIKDLIDTIKCFSNHEPKAMWIKRQGDRSSCAMTGEEIDDKIFPEIPVNNRYFDGIERKLLDSYLDYDSPVILQLTTLCEDTRALLEQLAWKHSRNVAQHYRLYPYIIDKEGLEVTLVKAKIMGEENPSRGLH